MVNAIAIMILIVVSTRMYKIFKNGGITDIRTEILHVGLHLTSAFILFVILCLLFEI
jgi:hypothetical protein